MRRTGREKPGSSDLTACPRMLQSKAEGAQTSKKKHCSRVS